MDYIDLLKVLAFNILPKISLVLGLVFVASYFSKKALNKLKTMPNEWLSAMGEVWYSPVQWLIWGLGIILSLEALSLFWDMYLPRPYLLKARSIVLIGGITWLLFLLKNRGEKILMQRVASRPTYKNDQSMISVFSKMVSVALASIAGLMILSALEVKLAGLLAFGTLGTFTFALTFAGQDVGKNFFGGLMIYINRPFAIGDWIYSPNKNFEGVVENIGWYMTQIRTFERRPTYIPNAIITDAIIENPGRMYNRRIKQTVGVRYKDSEVAQPIVSEIERMLQSHKDIAHDQTLMVHLVGFGPSSLNIEIYCFTKTTNWAKFRKIQQDVLLKVTRIVASHDAEIAFPTSTLYIEGGTREPAFT